VNLARRALGRPRPRVEAARNRPADRGPAHLCASRCGCRDPGGGVGSGPLTMGQRAALRSGARSTVASRTCAAAGIGVHRRCGHREARGHPGAGRGCHRRVADELWRGSRVGGGICGSGLRRGGPAAGWSNGVLLAVACGAQRAGTIQRKAVRAGGSRRRHSSRSGGTGQRLRNHGSGHARFPTAPTTAASRDRDMRTVFVAYLVMIMGGLTVMLAVSLRHV
jgi:hypothetical protein